MNLMPILQIIYVDQLSTGEKDGSKVVDPEGTVYFEG